MSSDEIRQRVVSERDVYDKDDDVVDDHVPATLSKKYPRTIWFIVVRLLSSNPSGHAV